LLDPSAIRSLQRSFSASGQVTALVILQNRSITYIQRNGRPPRSCTKASKKCSSNRCKRPFMEFRRDGANDTVSSDISSSGFTFLGVLLQEHLRPRRSPRIIQRSRANPHRRRPRPSHQLLNLRSIKTVPSILPSHKHHSLDRHLSWRRRIQPHRTSRCCSVRRCRNSHRNESDMGDQDAVAARGEASGTGSGE
jgi:hypothetical protein